MPISLHAATVASFTQGLGAVAQLLDKAAAFAAERGIAEADLVGRRLADDMLPFGYQAKSCVSHSIGAIEGVRAGVFNPDMSGWPHDVAGLRGKIDEALTALATISPEEVEGFVGRDMRFEMGDMRMPFTAEDFLLSFSIPNFYFHMTTAYGLLRTAGLPLGKRHFLGRPRLKA